MVEALHNVPGKDSATIQKLDAPHRNDNPAEFTTPLLR